MKVKGRNMVEVILQGILIVCLFIPGMFEYTCETSDLLAMSRTVTSPEQVSFYDRFTGPTTYPEVLGWLTLAIMCVGFLVYIFQLMGKGKRQNLFAAFLIPAVEIVLLIVSALYEPAIHFAPDDYIRSYDRYDPIVLFTVAVGIGAALFLVALLGYIKAAREGIIEEKKESGPQNSMMDTPDELKKYKELLDSGVITQEEFDAKKKQLLGM